MKSRLLIFSLFLNFCSYAQQLVGDLLYWKVIRTGTALVIMLWLVLMAQIILSFMDMMLIITVSQNSGLKKFHGSMAGLSC